MSNKGPVSPVDVTDGFRPKRQRSVGFSEDVEEKGVYSITRSVRSNSDSSEESGPRRARFTEQTAVISPAAGPGENRGPFADAPIMSTNTATASDFGFGYISDNNPVEQQANVPTNLHPNGHPLKSALKTPGTSTRFLNPLSPTFKEEAMLEREEEKTEVQQAKDLKVKTRVRMAKMVLRGVNFSCSLIVLAMLSTTLNIFHATKGLPNRNGTSAWSPTSQTWPQIVVLTVSCISLLFSIIIMAAYCRGGHKRAQKVAVYYTMFAVGYFVFSVVMWLFAAAIMQGTKTNPNTGIWGWACKDNKRRAYYQNDVQYALVCRLQDWSLICCIIEIIVELMVIAIYSVVFYRFHSKAKLRKSMDARDRARSDLYLAQLRSQSAPNTPGFAMTPRNPYFPSVNTDQKTDPYSRAENGESPTQYASITPTSATTSSPFKLQAPPIKIHGPTPRINQDGFEPATSSQSPPLPSLSHQERHNDHIDAAPGEQVYESVPIPGAYAGSQQQQQQYGVNHGY